MDFLLPTKDTAGRVAALENMLNMAAVANIIRQEKWDQLQTAMRSRGANGMQTMDTALTDRLRKGRPGALEACQQANKNRPSNGCSEQKKNSRNKCSEPFRRQSNLPHHSQRGIMRRDDSY